MASDLPSPAPDSPQRKRRMRIHSGLRVLSRLVILVLALSGIFPLARFSPLALTAGQVWPWLLLPIGLLAILPFRPRLFCRWICPVGLLLRIRKTRTPPLAKLPRLPLLPICLGATLAGYTLYGLCEPSSLLASFTLSGCNECTPMVLCRRLPSLLARNLLPALVLLSLLLPGVWCAKVCPLGALQDWLSRLRQSPKSAIPGRRAFLFCGAGAATAYVLRQRTAPALRPPMASRDFLRRCIRCGACAQVCPTRIIHFPAGGLLAPEIRFGEQACSPDCIACTNACPTGALKAVASPAEKKQMRIGIAVVDQDRCRQSRGRECGICANVCPHRALDSLWDGERMRSIIRVHPERCTGCGICRSHCPTPTPSIDVRPLAI